MHSLLPFLIGLIAAIVLLTTLANKLKIAYPIVLVLAGLSISFVPGVPVVRINPDLIFFIFLPPLLFEAAWSVSFKEMKKWWRIITSFAFLVVLFTAGSVGVFTHYFIPGFTLALGFLLGGIVSPPDAVSTAAITKFVKIPKTPSSILEGESLLNDASSLIIFRFALVAVATGHFSWQEATQSFLWMVFGGASIGLALAWLIVFLQKRLPTDAPSDIVLTIITPYFLYWLAETVHSSGVLAVVSGGLFMADRRLLFLNSASRVQGYSVWESFVFILNGLVFMLIGLGLPEIMEGIRAKGIPISTAIGYGVAVTALLIFLRIFSYYVAMLASYFFRRSSLPATLTRKSIITIPILMGWTGIRGVVSLAAALAIPLTLDDGTAFPYRNLLLFITFIVILLTLVIQGLTLPYFIRRSPLSKVFTERPEEEEVAEVRQKLLETSYAFMLEKQRACKQQNPAFSKLMHHWEEKVKTAGNQWLTPENKTIYLELLEAQRQELNKINKQTHISEEVIRKQLYLIDLEEERVKRL